MTLVDRARVALLLAIPGLLLASADVHAQSAEAEVLFREGRKLLKAGRTQAGCDKIEASERIETSIGTLLNLGDCREKLGRFASAWAAFRKAEAIAKRASREDKRRAEAARRANALEPRLSNLVIQVPNRVPGLVVTRDGEVVDPAAWSSAVPLDPDTYTIVAEAPGHKPWRREVPIGATKLRRQVVVVPPLEPAPVAAKPAEPPATVGTTPETTANTQPAAPTDAYREQSRWTTARKISAGVAVLGAATLSGGIVYGLNARDEQRQSNELCPDTFCDSAEGLRLNDRAQRSATRANIMYGVGGAAIAASVALWFLGAPDDEAAVTPAFGDGSVGVSFGGKF